MDLNGAWERRLDGELYDVIPVPSSQRPLGAYNLGRKFLLPKLAPGQRAFLRFESIHYYGKPSVNGAELGEMGPYVPYEFEVTRHAREGSNEVGVALMDAGPGREEIVHGLSYGWEASGGIIREVYIELRPAVFIDNVAFAYTLAEGYAKASCHARLMVSSAAAGEAQAEIVLMHGNSEVARARKQAHLPAGQGEIELAFDVANPLLWSPQTPNLYRLQARLGTTAGEDSWTTRTGFRDVEIRGRNFLLNGNRLVLAGVCRHDMWKDQGFTLTREQMALDMRMIKMMGANFVRLAHYPHHRHILELADELGLFVTEEPGHWNVEFKKMPRARIDVSLAIMERAIRRDWNSPSIFAWLLGNECTVTVEYLREGKSAVQPARPDRAARFLCAHLQRREADLRRRRNGFLHAPHVRLRRRQIQEGRRELRRRTNLWSTRSGAGKSPGGPAIVYERNFDRLMDLVERELVAGHSFWSWQDIREYTRMDWPTQNGILLSGVVDEAREPRERLYVELARLFQMRRHEVAPARTRPEPAPLRFHTWSPKSRFERARSPTARRYGGVREGLGGSRSAHCEVLDRRLHDDQWKRTGSKFLLWQGAELNLGGVPFLCPLHGEYVRPLVVTPELPSCRFRSASLARNCTFSGHVTLPDGYPVRRQAGRDGGDLHARGRRQSAAYPAAQRNRGARANMIHAATRIDPIAAAAPRALTFTKDVVREQYQVLLFSIPVPGGKADRLLVKLSPGAQPLALFAITAERA